MAERKKFINVEIPILNKTIQVLGTPKDLENKTIKMDLSKQLRGKGLTVTFQILNEDENLVAYPKKFELTKSYLRRIIRKRTDNVEDSFKATAKDVTIILKPFLITRKKVSRAVRKNLRNTTKDFLLNYVKEKTYLELCNDLLEGSVQKELLPKLKKVYPLAFCDLRVVETNEILKADKTKEERIVEEEDSKEENEETSEEEDEKKESKKTTKKVAKKEDEEEEDAGKE